MCSSSARSTRPGRDNVLIGTLASGGFETVDTDALAAHGIDRQDAERELARARRELAEQERLYRGNGPAPDIDGRTIILVYDGMATGESMLARDRRGPRHGRRPRDRRRAGRDA